MDLATLMQQAAALTQQQAGLAQQVSGKQAEAAGIAQGAAEGLKTAATNTYEAELTRLEGELATQQARVKVANAFGTNANSVSDVITGLAGTMRQTALDLTTAQAEVQRIESNSDLFGNPLGWLEDLVRGDEVRGQRDALAKTFELQGKVANQLNAATQTSVQTQNMISESLSATSIKGIAQAKAAVVNAQAADAAIQAAQLGAASIETLMQQGDKEFQRTMSLYNASQQAESMRLARAERAERLKEKQAVEAEIIDITENINAFNRQYGRPEVPVSFVKRHYGSSGQFGEFLREADVSGMQIRKGVTEGSLGSKPSETFSRVETLQLQLPPAWKASTDVYRKAEDRFNQQLDVVNPQTGKTLRQSAKPEELRNVFDQQVQAVAEELQAKIEHGTGNPFQVPPIESVLQSTTPEVQALAQSNFRKVVLDSLVTTGMSDPTPELLMATSLSAVEKGEISMREAVEGGVAFYRGGHNLKVASGGFTSMNIPVVPMYNVDIGFLTKEAAFQPRVNIFGTGASITTGVFSKEQQELRKNRIRTLNLTKPEDYTTALTIMMSQRRAQQIQSNMQGSGSK